MLSDPCARLGRVRFTPEEAARRAEIIGAALVAGSSRVTGPSFCAIGRDDLERLYALYDAHFFEGALSALMAGPQGGPLSFRLSPRMTRAAGKTFFVTRRVKLGTGSMTRREYQIAISTLLLFQSFRDDAPGPVQICGRPCPDRLQALLRVFEHELIHLIEFVVHGESSCAAAPFKALSRRIFGHEGIHHDLLTPREQAARRHEIRVGDAVCFSDRGRDVLGLVNRITRRATVLVESPQGRPFSDGRRYLTYYVPVEMLRPAAG